MAPSRQVLYTGPMLLVPAFMLVGLAVVEKALNVVGWSLPLVPVFPRQLLDWAVVLIMFEIALTLRQILEHTLVREVQSAEPAEPMS